MRFLFAALLELLGLVLITGAFWMLAAWAGVLVAGLAAVLCGLALDPPKRGNA